MKMNRSKPHITWYLKLMVSMKATATKFWSKTDADKIDEKKYIFIESDMIFQGDNALTQIRF